MKRKADLEKIYLKSRDLFLSKGYEAVKMDDICQAVGISKPTLYALRITKRDLLVHAYKPDCKQFYVDERAGKTELILPEIFNALDLVIERITCNGPDLLRDLLKLHLKKPALDEIMDQEWLGQLTLLITAAQERRQVGNMDDPDKLARIICAYIIGYSFQFAMQQAEESRTNLHAGAAVILRAEEYYAG